VPFDETTGCVPGNPNTLALLEVLQVTDPVDFAHIFVVLSVESTYRLKALSLSLFAPKYRLPCQYAGVVKQASGD
jgi:hypothetical protein